MFLSLLSSQNARPNSFNKFLQQVRDDLTGTRYSPFWDAIIEKGTSLITGTECPESDVTDDEAIEVS